MYFCIVYIEVNCNFKTKTEMNKHLYEDLTIEFLDVPTYKFGSAENNFVYSKAYFAVNAEQYPTSKHGIKVENSSGPSDLFSNFHATSRLYYPR